LSGSLRIRDAEPADVELLFSFVVELATFERAPDEVTGSPGMLEEALFGPDAVAEALIAELDGAAVGFVLFFRTFSTWLCRPGIWLEDLYVSPAHRRGGVGRALLAHLARLTVSRGYGRLEWSALLWNTPALDFYDGLGARRLEEWETFRLEGRELRRVAGG
jgi:GNAT superfamily N-acetyltransferase